jgi:hypothetical protein
MPMADLGHRQEFAERGFVVLPRVVPPGVLAAAARAADQLVGRDPPGVSIGPAQ